MLATGQCNAEEEKYNSILNFLKEYQLGASKKKLRDLMTYTEPNLEGYKINIIIAHCCKNIDVEAAMSAYLNAKQNNIPMHNDAYLNLLSLVAGLGEVGSGHTGPARAVDFQPPHNLEYAITVFQDIKVHREKQILQQQNAIYDGKKEMDGKEERKDAEVKNSGTYVPDTTALQATGSPVIKLSEASYTAMIRCYCMNHRGAEALKLYKELVKATYLNAANEVCVMIPKLRTFHPLLQEFGYQAVQAARSGSDTSDLSICMDLWHEMTVTYKLIPCEREYIAMLYTLQQLQNNLFYVILKHMNEYIPICCYQQYGHPSNGTYFATILNIIKDWFEGVGRKNTASTLPRYGVHNLAIPDEEGLLPMDALNSFTTDVNNEGNTKTTVSCKPIPKLSSIDLDLSTRVLLLEQINKQVLNSRNMGKKGNGKPMNNKLLHLTGKVTTNTGETRTAKDRTEKEEKEDNSWEAFEKWVDRRVTLKAADEAENSSNKKPKSVYAPQLPVRHYSIVIDGANVGYYKTNYSGAPTNVDYIQIHWLILHLLSIGHYPLLILHARHTFDSVIRNSTSGASNTRTPYSNSNSNPVDRADSVDSDTHSMNLKHHQVDIPSIIAFWKQSKILYTTPTGSNDDWYWLYATVKLNCSVVTNDEMRDHHFKMLAPRWFTLWKQRHQIHFSLGPWIWNSQQSKSYQSLLSMAIPHVTEENSGSEESRKRTRDMLERKTDIADSAVGETCGWTRAETPSQSATIGSICTPASRELLLNTPGKYSFRNQIQVIPDSSGTQDSNVVLGHFYFPIAEKESDGSGQESGSGVPLKWMCCLMQS